MYIILINTTYSLTIKMLVTATLKSLQINIIITIITILMMASEGKKSQY